MLNLILDSVFRYRYRFYILLSFYYNLMTMNEDLKSMQFRQHYIQQIADLCRLVPNYQNENAVEFEEQV